MKKEIYIDFYKNFMESLKVQSDNFFPNETIEMVQPLSNSDRNTYLRLQSEDECRVITREAFALLLFWVQNNEIEIEFFERFLSIAILFKEKIFLPISEDILPSMIEMMSVVGFKDHAIYTTIEIYIETPELLVKRFTTIH